MIVLCVPCLVSSVHGMDCLRERNCSCLVVLVLRAQSVDQTVTAQRGSVLDVRGPE